MSPRTSSPETPDSIRVNRTLDKAEEQSRSIHEVLLDIGTEIIAHERGMAIVKNLTADKNYRWRNETDYEPGLYIEAQLEPSPDGIIELTHPEHSRSIGRLAVDHMVMNALYTDLEMGVKVESRTAAYRDDDPFDYEILTAFRQWRKKGLVLPGILHSREDSL